MLTFHIGKCILIDDFAYFDVIHNLYGQNESVQLAKVCAFTLSHPHTLTHSPEQGKLVMLCERFSFSYSFMDESEDDVDART